LAVAGNHFRGFRILRVKSSAVRTQVDNEMGSISVITIGLFLVTIALLALITDIGSVAVAKRSLVHVTESAAIRAAHMINERSYYEDGASPGVPIDCPAARQEVNEEFDSWMQSSISSRRPELESIWVTNFSCAGAFLELAASARARLPFRLPSSSVAFVEIHSTVAVQSDRNG